MKLESRIQNPDMIALIVQVYLVNCELSYTFFGMFGKACYE